MQPIYSGDMYRGKDILNTKFQAMFCCLQSFEHISSKKSQKDGLFSVLQTPHILKNLCTLVYVNTNLENGLRQVAYRHALMRVILFTNNIFCD